MVLSCFIYKKVVCRNKKRTRDATVIYGGYVWIFVDINDVCFIPEMEDQQGKTNSS